MIGRRALGLGLGLAGCSQPPSEAVAREQPECASATVVWAEDAAGRVGQCEACHAPQAVEWRASLHRESFANAAFETSYRRTPFDFCRDCHAPQHTSPTRGEPPDPWAAANGVTCLDCHPIEPTHLTACAAVADAPHAVLGTQGSQACAGCHQFEFPGPAVAAPAGLMQRTLWEHARSPFADVACTDCHMPAVGPDGHRDHTFAASRDPSLLRASLTAQASRPAPDQVRFALAPVGVGHAFPTGDLFRRLQVSALARTSAGEVRATNHRYLARHFPPRRRGRPQSTALEADDRLTGPVEFELELAGAERGDTIEWRVIYQRVDHRDALHPERSTVHGETVLASGRL